MAAESAVSTGQDKQRLFLIVANMRCGTTWTQMMLGELADVATDFEFKWAPTYSAHPQHQVIPDARFSCRRALEAISDSAPVVGSKLVFDPVPMRPDEYRDLAETIESDIAILHIVRSYAEIANSFHRGFFHVLSRPDAPDRGIMHRALKDTTSSFARYARRSLDERRKEVSMADVGKLFRILLRNDLWAARLRCRNRYMRVSYRRIAPSFVRMARFVGSSASRVTIGAVLATPPTRKLPREDIVGNRLRISLLAAAFHLARDLGMAALFVAGWFQPRAPGRPT